MIGSLSVRYYKTRDTVSEYTICSDRLMLKRCFSTFHRWFDMFGCRHCWIWPSVLAMQSHVVWRDRTSIVCHAIVSTPSCVGHHHSKAVAVCQALYHFRRRALCVLETLSRDSCFVHSLASTSSTHDVLTSGWRYQLLWARVFFVIHFLPCGRMEPDCCFNCGCGQHNNGCCCQEYLNVDDTVQTVILGLVVIVTTSLTFLTWHIKVLSFLIIIIITFFVKHSIIFIRFLELNTWAKK